MPANFTYGFIDGASHKSYKGSNVASAPTLVNLQTFAEGLEAYSDAVLFSIEVSETQKVPYDLATAGAHGVELVGTVLLEDTSDGRVYAISVPAISEAHIDKNGVAQWIVLAASSAAIAGLFNTLTGLTTVVKSSFIQSKRTQ